MGDPGNPKLAVPRTLCQSMPSTPAPTVPPTPVPGPGPTNAPTFAPTQPPTCSPCGRLSSHMCHVFKCTGWITNIQHSSCLKYQNQLGFKAAHCNCDNGYCWDAGSGK